ncbi:membrane protein insertase YidC [Viridibacterium curvum]
MDFKRIVLTVIFTASCFILWQNWQIYNRPPVTASTTSSVAPGSASAPAASAASSGAAATATAAAPSGAVMDYKTAPRAVVTTDLVRAEVSALGGDIVRIELLKHKATEDKSQNFTVLDDGKTHTYVARSGLASEGLPNHRTVFALPTQALTLAEGQDTVQLKLAAQPVNGVAVTKVLTFRRGSYLIDVSYEVNNGGSAPLATQAYFELARDDKAAEHTGGFFGGVSTYTGPAHYTEEKKFQKVSFDDIAKGKEKAGDVTTKDGWVAMVQHYFVSAYVPQQGVERTYFNRKLSDGFFGTGVKLPVNVAAGQSAKIDMPLYVGPQEQKKLKEIAPGLDLVVDYGWVTLIAVPLFMLLSFIHGIVGNWGWAIILLTVLIKAVFFPLSAASYKSMAKMKTLMPKMKALQDRYKDDRMKLNQEMMQLYKTEKVNPMGGCLPILVQIPVFMALYWVLLGAVEMRQAPWLAWIHDLSAMDPFYVLPVLMAISMFIQTKLNPTPPDPMQAKMMLAMPLIFGVMFLWMPSGLVLYWVVNNVLSIGQQWYITKSIEGAQSK